MKTFSLILFLALVVSACSAPAAAPTATQPPAAPTKAPALPAPTNTSQPAAPTAVPQPTAAPTLAATTAPKATDAQVKISSPEFQEGQPIPKKFSCDGANTSPALAWSGIPAGAKSLALIMDDPDAPGRTYVHWVAYNLPVSLAGLPESVPAGAALSGGGSQGPGSSNKAGYVGPCPPSGTHRYFFKLYALDLEPKLAAGLDKAALEKQMDGHILGQAQLMGTYQR
jgi:hypothetical protein